MIQIQALILLISNVSFNIQYADPTGFGLNTIFLGGNYEDLTVEWYKNVGQVVVKISLTLASYDLNKYYYNSFHAVDRKINEIYNLML